MSVGQGLNFLHLSKRLRAISTVSGFDPASRSFSETYASGTTALKRANWEKARLSMFSLFFFFWFTPNKKMEYATGQNPVYSDHLPEDWLRLVKQDKEWLDTFQRYLNGAFRGVLNSNHDWSETLSRMESVEDACGSLDPENKTLSAYQAVSERLAMTARLDGARGFLAFHSVGSGKTVTSAACTTLSQGQEETSTSLQPKTICRRAWSFSVRSH